MYLRLFCTDQLVRFTFKKSMISFVVSFCFFFPEDSETFMLYYLLSFLCLNNKHADTNGSLKVFHQKIGENWKCFGFQAINILFGMVFPPASLKETKFQKF